MYHWLLLGMNSININIVPTIQQASDLIQDKGFG
jgi:hypothetical protein